MSAICSNCSGELNPEFSFCPYCSQKTALHRLSLHEVKHEALHYITHADKSFFTLIKSLLLKTGTVAAEYISGKRKKYFPPLNFFLLVAAIFVFLMSLIPSPVPADVLKDNPEISRIPNEQARMKVYGIYKRKAEAISFINKYANIMFMIALPLITLIFWLFYYKGNFNYTEHLIAGMYMIGFITLVYILVLVPMSVWLFPNSGFNVFLFFLAFKILYCSVYYYHFTAKHTKAAAFKAFGVSFCAIMVWTVLSASMVRLYISTGFWGLVN